LGVQKNIQSMSLTTDRNDPRLHQPENGKQNEVYLVLSDEELKKGFVRPVRTTYVHVGKPKATLEQIENLRHLTDEEYEEHKEWGYIAFLPNPEYPENTSVVGTYFTSKTLKEFREGTGCGTATTMGLKLAETYARDPKFYGATWCCGCNKHIDVNEFVWEGTNEKVGS
jgi:hypothetical protein